MKKNEVDFDKIREFFKDRDIDVFFEGDDENSLKIEGQGRYGKRLRFSVSMLIDFCDLADVEPEFVTVQNPGNSGMERLNIVVDFSSQE